MKSITLSFIYIILALSLSGCATVFYEDHYDAIEQAKASGAPILLYVKGVSNPDSAGGVDINIGFQNLSKKTVKYVEFGVLPYNAVGDVVASEIGGKTLASLNFTGPMPYDEYEYSGWENVWYNNSIECIEIVMVSITYMDGGRKYFENSEIKNISSPDLSYPFNDASSTCKY